MAALTLPLLTLLLPYLTTLASAACYYQNGTDVTAYNPGNIAYAACNASAEASMCCRINIADKPARDHCRADGFCDSPKYVYLWRESCTDPTWRSPHCQKLCLDYSGMLLRPDRFKVECSIEVPREVGAVDAQNADLRGREQD